MSYRTSTATDFLDLLNQLVAFATATGLQSVDSVVTPGTGYSVGDVLTLTGGTFSYAATVRVTTVGGGGAVTGAVIVEAGAYTVAPSDPVASTGGGDNAATFNLTYASNGFTTQRQSKEAVSATVGAGGSGYVVNDLLTVSGGTATMAARFRVTTIGGGGAVTAVALLRRGHYRSTPSNAAATSTDAAGTSATLNVTYQPVAYSTHREALSAAVAVGGSGYAAGDTLTVSGGTGTAAILKILTVSSGAVATTSVIRGGDYTSVPSNPVATTTSGGGSAATLTITYQLLQPDIHPEVILLGEGGGSDSIYVGIRALDDASGSGAYNWELAGMTGFNSASTFGTQPGVSPGRWENPDKGSYVPLTNGSIQFWLFADGFRIVGVFKIGSTYTNMYLGWINPSGTSAQYPYPLFVEGCSSLWNRLYSAAVVDISGLCDPVSDTATAAGPGTIRTPAGTWVTVVNSGGSGGTRAKRQKCVVYPCGTPDITGQSAADVAPTPSWDVYDAVPDSGSPGTANYVVMQTADTKTVLVPTMIIEVDPDSQVLGELRGVNWVSAKGNTTNLTPEDDVAVGTDKWLVFQNGNRTDLHAFVAVLQR